MLLVAGGAVGWALAGLEGAPTAERESLAATNKPEGAKGKTLGLSRVTVPPGAELALHHHEGTQIAHIDKGTLSYTVVEGSVEVRKGAADEDPKLVRKIKAGQTGPIKAGQWIVEQRSDHHMAANRGERKIVIYLATLLDKGAPPSTPG
jgi:mannose-6-phosphate isomerase-like protein (cupin superfamily)